MATNMDERKPSKAAVGPCEKDETENIGMRVIFLCAFVANTGFFHGYDNGVVSDVFTMPSFQKMMGWPEIDKNSVAFQKGLTVNGFNIGAALSAVLCGHLLVDRYGRKPALIAGSLVFALGGLVQSVAINPVMLILGRFIAGIGVGITSCAGPAYISEVAPSKIRGAMVGIYQSNICLAIVGASVLNYLDHDMHLGWRWSLGVQVVLGLITALGLCFVGDTPRFLESAGRSEEAVKVLAALRGDEAAARRELLAVRAELEQERQAGSATWGELFTNPHFRNVVILGCFVQFFQIITGINAMVSYGGTLFESLGVTGLLSALVPALFFFVGNAIGGFGLADRLGRRSLLIWGMAGMALTMLVGGILALASDAEGACGVAVIAMVGGYMFAFGISWGFGAWLYISEIMPLRVRGKAVGLCTAVNWGPANVISAFITPMMIEGPMKAGGTLLFFGLLSVCVVPFALLCLPETKGRTLEQITPMFRFKNLAEFRIFVRGNLRSGEGMGAEHGSQAASAQEQGGGKEPEAEAGQQELDQQSIRVET